MSKLRDMELEMDRLVAMEAARNVTPESEAVTDPTGSNRVRIISTYSREIPHCLLKRTDRVQARECDGVFLVELATAWEDGDFSAYHYRTFGSFRTAAAAMARGTVWLNQLADAPHACRQCEDH